MEGRACDLSFVCVNQEQKVIPVRIQSCKTRLPLEAGALLFLHGPYPSRQPSRPSPKRCKFHQRLALWLRWHSPSSRSLLLGYLNKCNHSKCFLLLFESNTLDLQSTDPWKCFQTIIVGNIHRFKFGFFSKELFILTVRLQWIFKLLLLVSLISSSE